MPEPRRIDMHVHMVGNGVAGSGGWLRLGGWHRWLAGFMVRQIGFPASVLTQDLESMYVPNDVVLELAATHPEFLAGVSIHPARSDALEELDRCLERGAVLMKCLPNCQNIDCSD